jgi:3',5'-cyclic-AMP phosphodiesterase
MGLGAGWVARRLSWPRPAWAALPPLRLALLADAHLKSGDECSLEAKALARAVAEINTRSPDLVLFAGDLAHRGRPDALDLGRAILADLDSPLWAVRGEADRGRSGDAPWIRRFGEPWFLQTYQGVHFLGVDTVLRPSHQGSAFEIGAAQHRWLADTLSALAPATPLVIVSHAPLTRLFYPWQQWTTDSVELVPHLSRFRQVLCLHGHGHGVGIRGQRAGVSDPPAIPHLALPATAWPRPQAVQGTPAVARPGLSPTGCGWVLATLAPQSVDFSPQLWRA